MPQFNSGTSWDQGLNSLGAMLFPDVSKIAQAGLYGAQQRRERLAGDTLIDQQRHLHELGGYPTGPDGFESGPAVRPPPTYYSQPGPRLPGQDIPKGPWPSQAGVGTGTAAGLPGQGQPSLAQTVAPSPPQDLPVAGAEEQVGMPGYQQGTAPKVVDAMMQSGKLDSAAPNAPSPMPSLQSSDGGQKFAPPASQDGTPAPPMDLAKIFVMAKLAGMSDAEAVNYASGSIIDMQQHGQIDKNTATQALAAAGRTGQLVADTAVATQAISTGGEVGQKNRAMDQDVIQVLTPENKLTGVSRDRWYPNQDKYRAVGDNAASVIAGQMYQPQNVYAKNPKTGEIDPRVTEVTTRADAIAGHRMPAPETPAMAPNTPKAEEGSAEREKILDKAINETYPVEKGEGILSYPRTEKSLLPPEWRSAVTNRALDIFNKDQTLRGDPKNIGEAYKRSLQSFQNEGLLPSSDAVKKDRDRWPFESISGGKRPLFGTDPALKGSGKTKDGAPIERFKINPLKPPPPEWLKASSVFDKVGRPNPKTPPPARGPGAARGQKATAGIPVPGGQEGEVHYAQDGTPLIIHNGVAVALSQQEQQQFQAALRAGGK